MARKLLTLSALISIWFSGVAVAGAPRSTSEKFTLVTKPFAGKSFFASYGPVRICTYMGTSEKKVFSAVPETVPAFRGELRRTRFTGSRHDSDIVSELGNPVPFTTVEFVAIVWDLVEQSYGETKIPLNGSGPNIFYVELDGYVFVACISFVSPFSDCTWFLEINGYGSGGGRWDDEYCVFSRD